MKTRSLIAIAGLTLFLGACKGNTTADVTPPANDAAMQPSVTEETGIPTTEVEAGAKVDAGTEAPANQ